MVVVPLGLYGPEIMVIRLDKGLMIAFKLTAPEPLVTVSGNYYGAAEIGGTRLLPKGPLHHL